MALTEEDLAALGSFLESKIVPVATAVENAIKRIEGVENAVSQVAQDAANVAGPQNRTAVVGAPDVHPEAGPEFWLHLADGSVITSHDSSSTHVAGESGESIAVIGRYQMGA